MSEKKHNKWVLLAILAVAQFMVVLDVSIVNVALPTIQKSLSISQSNLQWIVTAYTLTFGGFLLLGGRATDLFGRKKLFIIATALFSAMSLLCGLAATQNQIIIVRAAQGLMAALMSPAALSIVISEFKEGKERNTALGVWAGVAAGGGAAGVLFGGIITQYLGWRWNFFVNVPIGIFVAIACVKLLPKHIGEENKESKLDILGALLVTTGLMSIVYGLTQAPNHGWSSHQTLTYLIGGLILLIAFTFNEYKYKHPLMPLSIFRIRNVAGGNIAFLVVACTLFSMFFFLTLYVQGVLKYSPVRSGFSFLPVTFIIGATSAIISRVVEKIGYKVTLTVGPILLAIGLFVLSHSLKVGGIYWANVFPGLALCAMGMGFTFISGTLAATSGIPKHFAGLASGLVNTSQQVGGAVGLAVLSAISVNTITKDMLGVQKYIATSIANHHVISKLDSNNFAAIASVHGYTSALNVGVYLALGASLAVLLLVKNPKKTN